METKYKLVILIPPKHDTMVVKIYPIYYGMDVCDNR